MKLDKVEILPNMKGANRELAEKLNPCSECGSYPKTGGRPMWEWWEEFIECPNCNNKLGSGTSPYSEIAKRWNLLKQKDI